MTRKARVAIIVSVVTSATVLASNAVAAPPSPWTDISETARGRAAVARAETLFGEGQVRIAAADLRVFDVDDGDVLVVPGWVRPETFLTRDVVENGRVATEAEAAVVIGLHPPGSTTESAPALEGQLAAADGLTAAAAYWSQYDSGCFAWLKNGGSYMAPCYYVSKLINDGSSTRDYFALRQRASIGTQKTGSGNYDGWIMSTRTSGSPSQAWIDWEPGAEVRGNCGTLELSVAAKGVAIGISATACERWDPTLWEAAGHFRNKWNCDCFVGVSGMRQVASNIAVSVAQGKYPSWTLTAGFKGF
jgi:hypothetical protein